MFAAQLFTTVLAFLAVGVQASPLSPRLVIDPQITNPKLGSVWPIGTVQTVTWYVRYKISSGLGVKPCNRDTSNLPPESLISNLIGEVILGFNESDSLNLDFGMLSLFIHWHRALLQPEPIMNERPVYTLELATAMLHGLLPYPVKLCITSLYNDAVPCLHFDLIRCSLNFANLADTTASPEHPLAQNFNITDGSVKIPVPNVPPRTDYFVVCKFISYLVISFYILAVMGDSINTSPQFAITTIPAPGSGTSTLITTPIPITGGTSTDAPSTATDSTTAPLSTSTTPSSSSLSTSGSLSLYAPERLNFESLSLCIASMIMLIAV